jgi:hypothetical protein
MSWSCSRQLLPSALLLVAFACTSEGSSAPGPSGSGALVFDNCAVGDATCSLELAPNDVVDVGVATPNGVSNVTFALDGDYGDGVLESTKATTNDNHATVRLHAPSSPANFYLVASANKVTAARLYVAVSANGFATLRVVPQYTGRRPVPIVVASAFLKAQCRDLAALVPKDGAPVVVGTSGETLVLEQVPAGGHVAVTVRIAHYATGCVDIDALPPNATRDVPITVYDRPIDLAQTDLDSTLTFKPDPIDVDAWNASMAVAAQQALDAFSLSPSEDGKHLLDAMADSAGKDKPAFSSQRTALQWDNAVGTWVTSHGTLRAPAAKWLAQSLALTQKDFSFHLKASATLGYADVTPTTLGPLLAQSAGITAPVPFSWVGDADDSLHLAGSIDIAPTRLACAAADVSAMIDVPSSTDVPSALATKVDCKALGTALAQNGNSFGTCNAQCTANLCSSALSAMWKVSQDLSSTLSEQTVIGVNATVQGTVGEFAEPQSFTGAWIGQVSTPKAKFASKGLATGAQPPP